MLLKMTRRNQINLASIVAISAWAIFSFHLTKTQYGGLFLLLAIAPKLFWSSFDYTSKVDLHKVAAWFRSGHPAKTEDSKAKIELVS